MDGNSQLIIILIICIVLIYFVRTNLYNVHSQTYEDFMYGYWVADDGFCETAEISSMMLFIGDPIKWTKGKLQRNAYLVINNDVTNQPIKIQYTIPSTGYSTKLKKYNVKSHILFEEEIDIPSDVTLEFDIPNGKLRIHDGENLYALLFKDTEISCTLRKEDTEVNQLNNEPSADD